MRQLPILVLMVAANVPSAAATEPESFVFFNIDRQRIRETSFLETKELVGAQLKYTWRELEPTRDEYRLEPVLEDFRFLNKHGKKLFIQIQDVSFSQDIVNVPDYIREDPVYGGGVELVYDAHANKIGMGVGGPDLLPFRKGQLNHSYPLISARKPGTIAGVAVQWGNFDDVSPATGERTTVDEIYSFGRDVLRLDYIFWGTQEPHYSDEVIPYLRNLARTDTENDEDNAETPPTQSCS